MYIWSVARSICFCITMSACRSASSQSATENDYNQLLVGTWASANNTRKYEFESSGAFSFTLDPQRCAGALPSSKVITASGRWKREGTILALTVDNTSDAILSGSTMRDTLVTLDANALVLSSSIVVCGTSGAEEVQLHKR
jgi:hypothetical protein